MLIGIDASRAFLPAPTGTETYSREIISALLKAKTPHTFRLYARTPPDRGQEVGEGSELRIIPFPRLWTHFRLSAEIIANPVDALFVPSHVIPLFHPRRTVVTVHDLGFKHFPQTHRTADRIYLDYSTRWNVLTASVVIVDSESTLKDLVRIYRTNPAKIRLVYPALPSNFLVPTLDGNKLEETKARYGLTGDYVLSVGTIHPRKNYARLMNSFRGITGQVQLLVVGKNGWGSRNILSSSEQHELAGRIRFVDYVPPSDLAVLYSGARMLVFPSLYEGFGFPILEAQACGTPVACSNTSSLPEVAGEGAEYFDPLNEASIQRAIERVLSDDARRAELVKKGLANLNRFSWSNAATQILDTITSL